MNESETHVTAVYPLPKTLNAYEIAYAAAYAKQSKTDAYFLSYLTVIPATADVTLRLRAYYETNAVDVAWATGNASGSAHFLDITDSVCQTLTRLIKDARKRVPVNQAPSAPLDPPHDGHDPAPNRRRAGVAFQQELPLREKGACS